MAHPLLAVLENAAEGSNPPVDGGVTFLPELSASQRAVVALTGHAFVCTSQEPEEFSGLTLDGFGSALHPDVLLRLAGGGVIGVTDVILAIEGLGGDHELEPTTAWDEHPRVHYAREIRSDVTVFGTDQGFITLASGLAGRRELSIELGDPGVSPGAGRRLLAAARTLVAEGSWLFAAVSPGNVRSLRSFLAAGWAPVGSEVLITPPAASSASH